MKPLREELVSSLWQQAGPGWGPVTVQSGCGPPAGLGRLPQEGERLLIVYPGRRGAGMGPDFRDAILQDAQGARRGDVELHVRSSNWQAHRHHEDPSYNRVLLHVVWQHDGGMARREDGQFVPLLELSSALLSGQETPTVWPCQQLARAAPEAFAARLAAAGELRLVAKAQQFREELSHDDLDQVLYRAVAGGLGYARNCEPFRQLADWLPWSRLVGRDAPGDVAQLAALLLWGAGLDTTLRSAADPGGKEACLQAAQWEQGGRPGNTPRQRIYGLAQLLARWRKAGPWATTSAAFQGEPARIWSALVAMLMVPGFIGGERAALITGNEVLPLALAALEGEVLPADAREGLSTTLVTQLFRAAPALADNEVTRAMRRQTGWGRREGWAGQQGWHYLDQRYCRDKRCAECALHTQSSLHKSGVQQVSRQALR